MSITGGATRYTTNHPLYCEPPVILPTTHYSLMTKGYSFEIPRTLYLKICEVAEVSRGAQVPCPEKNVCTPADRLQMYTRVTPINLFVFESESQNDVVDRFIHNHIYPECQELTSDLKVARPIDEKIDFQLKTYRIFFAQKI